MKLSDILYPATTVNDAQVDSKKGILELISKLIAQHLGNITYEEILDSLINREKLGSTGIGHGIALPHSRSAQVSSPIAVLIRTHQAIEFDAVDNQPVDLFLGLIVPQEAEQHHLEIIAELANKFSNKKFRDKLRQAKDSKEFYHFACGD